MDLITESCPPLNSGPFGMGCLAGLRVESEVDPSWRTLIDITCTRSLDELLQVRRAYHARYKRSLKEDVAAHTKDDYRKVTNKFYWLQSKSVVVMWLTSFNIIGVMIMMLVAIWWRLLCCWLLALPFLVISRFWVLIWSVTFCSKCNTKPT